MTAEAPDRSIALRLPAEIYRAMIAHALREAPIECCGLLGGRRGRVRSCHELANADRSERRYSADPADLIAAVRAIRGSDQEVVAIYHSHPAWPAVPSRTDLDENYWGDVPRPIISLLEDPPRMRVWRLGAGDYEELPWCIEPDPGDGEGPQRPSGGGD